MNRVRPRMINSTSFFKSLKVFWHFFLLGWYSFGGPAAHLGIFRSQFVERLKWLSENDFAQLIALSQFLPGPGSSQVGFAIGLKHAGTLGGLMAFIGFTLPSFLIMFWVALYQPDSSNVFYQSLITSLKILAVVIVADAVIKMATQFCHNNPTRFVALATTLFLLLFPLSYAPIIALLIAFAMGWQFHPQQTTLLETVLCTPTRPGENSVATNKRSRLIRFSTFARKPMAMILVTGFVGLLLCPLFLPAGNLPELTLFMQFAQAGSLVFGGGHVVLPLLESHVGNQLGQEAFLSGYAIAQMIPGPMFSFAAYLGALLLPSAPLTGAMIATLGLFLPGLLLIWRLLNTWQRLSQNRKLQGGIQLVNAAVVGLLLATLITPIISSAVYDFATFLAAFIGFYLLQRLRIKLLWLFLGYGLILPLIFWLSAL